jgi:hypothetical protein
LNIEAALRIIDEQRQALEEALRAEPNHQIKLEILRAISANQDLEAVLTASRDG